MYKFIPVIALLLFFCDLQAQKSQKRNNKIEVGKPFPVTLFKKINYYPGDELNLQNLRGKWVILDFWNIHCIDCIKSFPKMNAVRADLKDSVEIILIGLQDKEKKIKKLFEKFQSKLDLKLPVIYDSTLFKRFGIQACPYVVILDGTGIVRAITYSVGKEDMRSFMAGNEPALGAAFTKSEADELYKFYDSDKPLLMYGNGGNDSEFLFRSVLTKWKDLPTMRDEFISSRNHNRIQATGIDLFSLYWLAYCDTVESRSPRYYPIEQNTYGNWWLSPVLELKNPSDFASDFNTGKNIYNYSLIVPKERGDPLYLQSILRSELNTFFPYKVTVQKRRMPYWRLVLLNDSVEKTRTNSQTQSMNFRHTGFALANQPVQLIVNAIFNYNQLLIITDETGIKGNIDITMNCIMTDFNEIIEALRKNGLDLVQGEKEMNVIVVSD